MAAASAAPGRRGGWGTPREDAFAELADELAEAPARRLSPVVVLRAETRDETLHEPGQDETQGSRGVCHHGLPDVNRRLAHHQSGVAAERVDGAEEIVVARLAESCGERATLRLGADPLVVGATLHAHFSARAGDAEHHRAEEFRRGLTMRQFSEAMPSSMDGSKRSRDGPL